ncbi:MAG: hypothetical protein COW30_02440 [Rhodospirillales bacterium CG15_BIG_FIL_POST_REV_8_21_14_020_66_15]|nr:MAG: hypothetical protein COW30_02440 [Rhodospirillales bacterium CG15_BIG_FIL_POST_REV_8_21_14_020_66_15]
MLSDDIHSLRAKLETYRKAGVILTPAAVTSLCATIHAVEDGVRLMEKHTVEKPCIRVLPQRSAMDVVDLNEEKARRDIERWISGQGVLVITGDGPDGGDAA